MRSARIHPKCTPRRRRVDRELGRFVSGVETLGLQARVHWIVVSDHGMAQLSGDRVIVLDDLVDLSDVEVLETGSMLTLNPAERRHRRESIVAPRTTSPSSGVPLDRSAGGVRAGWASAGAGHHRPGG